MCKKIECIQFSLGKNNPKNPNEQTSQKFQHIFLISFQQNTRIINMTQSLCLVPVTSEMLRPAKGFDQVIESRSCKEVTLRLTLWVTCSCSVRFWIHSWDLWLVCIKFLLLTILQVWVMAEILLQYLSGLCEVIINHLEILGPERRKLSRIPKWKPNLQAFKIFSLKCS